MWAVGCILYELLTGESISKAEVIPRFGLCMPLENDMKNGAMPAVVTELLQPLQTLVCRRDVTRRWTWYCCWRSCWHTHRQSGRKQRKRGRQVARGESEGVSGGAVQRAVEEAREEAREKRHSSSRRRWRRERTRTGSRWRVWMA
jgi:hypothetical protein